MSHQTLMISNVIKNQKISFLIHLNFARDILINTFVLLLRKGAFPYDNIWIIGQNFKTIPYQIEKHSISILRMKVLLQIIKC